jgi:hypothetical protein
MKTSKVHDRLWKGGEFGSERTGRVWRRIDARGMELHLTGFHVVNLGVKKQKKNPGGKIYKKKKRKKGREEKKKSVQFTK